MLGTAKCWVGISHKPFEGELLAQWLKDFVQTPFVHIPSTCRPPRKSSLSQFQPSMVPSLTINVSSTFTTCLLCKPGSTLEVYMQRLPGHATLHQRVPEVNLQHVASFACSTCYHSHDIQNNYNRYNELWSQKMLWWFVSFPESFNIIMSTPGNHHHSLGCVVPHTDSNIL